MTGGDNLNFWTISFAMLALIAFASRVESQGAPPPAVTVKPVVSRQVTDTGTFIGRVVPIDRVEIVARFPGLSKNAILPKGSSLRRVIYSFG